jgi:hypothetical protein
LLGALKDVLREIARGNESTAAFMLQCVPHSGIWELAIDLLESFPDSERIRSIVAARAEQMQEVIIGRMSVHYRSCAAEMDIVLRDSRVPNSVRPFLEQLRDSFIAAAAREERTEDDENVNW